MATLDDKAWRMSVRIVNLIERATLESAVVRWMRPRVQVPLQRQRAHGSHWIWVRGIGPPIDAIILFDTMSARRRARRLLEDFTGILQTKVRGVLRGCRASGLSTSCYAHAAPQVEDAAKAQPIPHSRGTMKNALD